jgi:hypothetical protein
MSQTSQKPADTEKPLRQNPFTTYRDPVTGQWVVVKPLPQESFSL